MLVALLLNIPLQGLMIAANFAEEQAWFDQLATAPYSSIAYFLGRLLALPVVVGVVVGSQNLIIAAFRTNLVARVFRWPWGQAALWLLGLMLLFGGIQPDDWTGERNTTLILGAGICWAAALGLGFLRKMRKPD